ncbi:MAG: AI-2E family transporter [Candidatus Faecousia sp.]|nr:AI-2E family transporter [Candidatus Faecousia sp.]
MKDPYKRRYFFLMMSLFGGMSLSIVVFFVVYRFQGIGDLLHELRDILAPFIYGGVVAYLLRPMCNAYEKKLASLLPKGGKRFANALAVALSLLTGILLVYALIIMIAPQLFESISSLWISIPDKISRFVTWATDRFGDEEMVARILELFNTNSAAIYAQLEDWGKNLINPYLSGLSSIVSGVGSSLMKIFKFLYNMLIGLIVACYLLASRKRFARQSVMVVRSILKPRWADLFLEEVAFVDRMFGGFIDGKLLDSAIIGVLCYIGCVIFRFPNALLVSTFIGVTNVIPFFGPFIGAVPATLLIMIENPIKGLWFIVFVLALQQLDGNVIGPKILGNRTGLSSFWVLFAIVLCGGLWGVAGMVICVPMFAVLYDIVKKLVRRGLTRKGQIQLWEQYRADYPEDTGK